MRACWIVLALLLAGCRTHVVAPLENVAPSQSPHETAAPTRSVEIKDLRVAVVTAQWFTVGVGEGGAQFLVPHTGPAIEFNAGLDLHGWEMDEFKGTHTTRPVRWSFQVSIDEEGDGVYDGEWNHDIHHWDFTFGTNVNVHDRSDEKFEREINHPADFTMWAADQDALAGRAGVRFSIPLEDVGLTQGPVRYRIQVADDLGFPSEEFIGIAESTGTLARK